MFDEDLPIKRKSGFEPQNLETLSVDDLQEYVKELESEIDRVKKDIEQKKNSQDAASSVFKF